MVVYPPAKINIGLFITGKRPDGFHNIETVFYPISLTDTLEINLADTREKLRFTSSGIVLPGGVRDNLCCKAYHLLDAIYGLPPAVIKLHKNIPAGAGLGGGSSDAAHTLRALNVLCRLQLSNAELSGIASRLGSDCAFFLQDNPALGTGKGDVLEPVSMSLAHQHILLVKPPVSVSTSDAYAAVKPAVPQQRLPGLLQAPAVNWRHTVVNDFETSVFAKFPEIERIKEWMYASGALYASMSGSGSSVYGIFEQIPAGVNRIFPDCFIWHS
jgi:4-diphosphocytidyl-2-C-methyl-D-erythritol kinase